MRIKGWFYFLSKVPARVWAWIQNLYWKIMFRFFLPTVWVQPNMRSGLIEYIQYLRKAQNCKKEDLKRLEAEMKTSGLLTGQELKLLLEYILHGELPYPTVEEAIEALPRMGGTIRCGEGVQYLMKPILFPAKSIQLIGGQFCSMGKGAIETISCKRLWIIGCVFRGGGAIEASSDVQMWIIGCVFMGGNGPGPRDWSPRGEIIEGDGSSEMIRVNL